MSIKDFNNFCKIWTRILYGSITQILKIREIGKNKANNGRKIDKHNENQNNGQV